MRLSCMMMVSTVVAMLSGCANLAPDYARPPAPVPASWPGTATTGAVAFDELGWAEFIADARLREVVALGLANNRDLRIALLNIDKARASFVIQDATRYPALGASAGVTRQHQQGTTAGQATAALGVSGYELDLFGKARNLSDAAREAWLAQAETRRSTQISLIAETAIAWLTLAADVQRLALAQATFESQRASYDLNVRSHALGAASGLTLAQAQTTVESARADIASYQSQVQQDRNALDLLVGSTVPARLLPDMPDGAAGSPLENGQEDASVLVALPDGLPSSVLERRPDVLAAEHALQAANADIGAARAAFFPDISLTASASTASAALGNLFAAGSGAWTFAPALSLPIFDAGSRKAALASASSERDIALATYEKTLQSSFREVADALAVRTTMSEQLAAQTALVAASQKSYQLSDALFHRGGANYLDVLTAQRSLYTAQQGAISLRLAEQSNRVTLYKVLGGGA